MKRSGLFWHYVYIVLFAVFGAVFLCLSRISDYAFPMAVWGICWLVLAAGTVPLACAARRSGRDFRPLLQSCVWGMIGAAGLYESLACEDAFQRFLGVLWFGLAAKWLIQAVRGRRGDNTAA